MGGRAASVASGGADTEGRTGRGHVNLADADGITLTTAGGARARLYAETRCNESDRPSGSVGGSSTSTPPPSPQSQQGAPWAARAEHICHARGRTRCGLGRTTPPPTGFHSPQPTVGEEGPPPSAPPSPPEPVTTVETDAPSAPPSPPEPVASMETDAGAERAAERAAHRDLRAAHENWKAREAAERRARAALDAARQTWEDACDASNQLKLIWERALFTPAGDAIGYYELHRKQWEAAFHHSLEVDRLGSRFERCAQSLSDACAHVRHAEQRNAEALEVLAPG